MECLKFDDYFSQQLKELEGTTAYDGGPPGNELGRDIGGGEPPLPGGLVRRGNKHAKEEVAVEPSPAVTPTASRPSTPAGASHLVTAKAGPMAKLSRRAKKAQQSTSAPASSGDEASTRKKAGKTAKKGRKWDADGLADEDDGTILDYSASNALTSDSDVEPVGRSSAVEEVDASTWGSKKQGKFVLRDLGDEVHAILAEAQANKPADTAEGASGLLGSSLSTIGGLFRNVIGGKSLTKEDLAKAMKGMEDHLLRKNVAREAAVRLCEGVEQELIGVKTGSFESKSPDVWSDLAITNITRHQREDTKRHGGISHQDPYTQLLPRPPPRDRFHHRTARDLAV